MCDQLAQVGADAVRAGLVVGSGGNLSVRAPGGAECWVTARGTWLDRLTLRDFVPVRIADGAPLDPAAPVASTEVALHLHTYRARPDVTVVVHLHPQSVLLLDALGERIRLVTTDHAFYVGRIARVGAYPPGSTLLAERAAAAATEAECVILAHHGCSVLADSVELAHKRVRNLEEAAQLTYRAVLLGRGDIPECPPDVLPAQGQTATQAI
ncbi:class II aldolase/adducin family protein [Natronosporangium hydrolyticum]|uniref:class II aldolase/adducin family protein n=1 Tax=Natronosporangium hydrolyticum TaxID=2811111 RepID=UPI0023BA6E51|nr:class II aldolase/adducin family protein [Natronosporangium hydrolyticum]